MPHTLRRRARVAGLLTVIVLCGLPGVAAADRADASAGTRWLARQLAPDGTLHNPLGGALPDHGLMLDTWYALYATGDGDRAAPIVGYMERHATDYYTWAGLVPEPGFENIIVGGAVAKLLVAAEIAGRDPRNFGGTDLVAETRGAVMRSGPDKGRVSDYAKTPDMADYVTNNANTFGQALGVIGLAGAGENDRLAIDTLLTQQCSEGYFRIFFGYVPTTETGEHVTPNGYKLSTCDEGKPAGQSASDGDATGLALSALLAARDAGATGLDEPIARTVAWLKANQHASGGWGGGVGTEAPNTNSTGLITQALADAGGAAPEVARGLAFLRSAQVTSADAGTALADHVGAIAYTPDAYVAARTGGIVGMDTWIRASAQASLGLAQVGFHDLTKGTVPVDPEPERPPVGTNPPPVVTPPPVSEKAGAPAPPRGTPRGTPVTPATSAAQPGASTPAGALGAYLAGSLVDGDHVEVVEDGVTYVDYDATADLVLALHALGEQTEAAERASRFLLEKASVDAYAHGAPYEKDASYATPLAKLRIIAGFLNAESGALDRELASLRGKDGRFTDRGAHGDANDSADRHALAILATTAGGRTDDGALDLLIERQCADGSFPASLDTKRCEAGDLASTSAALLALNGKRRLTPAAELRVSRHTNGLPPDNVRPRADAVARAATALTAATDADGVIRDEHGAVDVVASAASAAGRQTAGLDAGVTARTLGGLVRADGGLPKHGSDSTDLMTSVAAAPGVAGRSWTSAEQSPIAPNVRLPLAGEGRDTPAAAAPTNPWLVPGLVALGLLSAAAVGGRFIHHRITRDKGTPTA